MSSFAFPELRPSIVVDPGMPGHLSDGVHRHRFLLEP